LRDAFQSNNDAFFRHSGLDPESHYILKTKFWGWDPESSSGWRLNIFRERCKKNAWM